MVAVVDHHTFGRAFVLVVVVVGFGRTFGGSLAFVGDGFVVGSVVVVVAFVMASAACCGMIVTAVVGALELKMDLECGWELIVALTFVALKAAVVVAAVADLESAAVGTSVASASTADPALAQMLVFAQQELAASASAAQPSFAPAHSPS